MLFKNLLDSIMKNALKSQFCVIEHLRIKYLFVQNAKCFLTTRLKSHFKSYQVQSNKKPNSSIFWQKKPTLVTLRPDFISLFFFIKC